MAVICPTITAENPHTYREQVARVEPFASRLHIDLADGEFAPTKLVGVAQIYWPETMVADLHIMYKRPQQELETIIGLQPNLVVVHAEADGDVRGMLLELQSVGIKAGVALLKDTEPEAHQDLLSTADHVLLFAGNLGYQGGSADMSVLKKIADIRMINPTAELGWDGGITAENVPLLLQQGVEVLNVGGYIHRADDPAAAYQSLTKLLASE
jgi:ribulose-phosphate 3-epimerase